MLVDLSTIAWWAGSVLAAVVGLIALGWGLHRLCICLEDQGYLYYRQKAQGSGVRNALMELDRMVRPAVEHTIEMETSVVKEAQRDVGGG